MKHRPTSIRPSHPRSAHARRARLARLLGEIRACTHCAAELPLGPRPVLRASATARLLIVGQAPGRRVHESGTPWDDPSGDRLREWIGLDRRAFYDERNVAIVPMGFCYPGQGRSGDLPPRPECAALWLDALLGEMPKIELTLLVGRYAQAYFLGQRRKPTLAETVRAWREYLPAHLPLPHPSGRNNGWLKKNAWFETDVLRALRRRCRRLASRKAGTVAVSR